VVEFAIVVSVLMLLILSMLDMGRAVYAYSTVANAAREGARYGTISPSDSAGITARAQAAAVALDPSQLTVNVDWPTSDTVRVQVSYNFQLLTPLVSDAAGMGAISLASTATMYTGY
jgi:Flp pilus assembly protein TadG